MSNDFRPAQNYHYPGAALFTALCGHVNDPADPATGLTTRHAAVNCETCRRLIPGILQPRSAGMVRYWKARQAREAIR